MRSERSEFYEEGYATHDERNQRWRALVASQNIKPLLELWRRGGGAAADRLIDVGCGDGSLLAQMAEHDLARRMVGYEIAPSAVRFAAERGIPHLERVELFDGRRIHEPDDSFDVGVLNFVLEHTEDPGGLLGEVRRVARYVLISVILDDTLSARRRAHGKASAVSGHIQRFNRATIRRLIAESDLRIRGEIIAPPSVEVAVFWAGDRRREQVKAHAVAYLKQVLHRAAPPLARRLFAPSYRALCQRA